MYYTAGFWRRFAADILDSIVIGGLLWVLFDLIFGFDYSSTVMDIVTTILYVVYAIFLPIYWGGYNVGKRIMKIHIERVDGQLLNFWTMFKREVLGKQLLFLITFGIAGIVSAFMVGIREDKRGLHDLIAGTHVMKD